MSYLNQKYASHTNANKCATKHQTKPMILIVMMNYLETSVVWRIWFLCSLLLSVCYSINLQNRQMLFAPYTYYMY